MNEELLSKEQIDEITHPKCECCGNRDHIAGVAASPLGAMSFCCCKICLTMDAQPLFMIEAVIVMCGGIENVHKGLQLVYHKNDLYYDYRTGKQIGTVEGKLRSRTELIEMYL